MLNFELTRNQVWLPKLNFKTFRTPIYKVQLQTWKAKKQAKTRHNSRKTESVVAGSLIQIQVFLLYESLKISKLLTNK